ncbi:MAG TPA: formylglycine-generating enzyme family protein [Planctomycetota bacterium]|nr:formylglycine-generating enzyme family protein [Planctomycetota bacterium]
MRRRAHLASLLLACSCLSAGDAEKTFPLWNGEERIADYAQRVHLPATQRLDLGGGVSLDLVLVPAGKFVMGTPSVHAPEIPAKYAAIALGASAALALMFAASLLIRSRLSWRFPFSLRGLAMLYGALLLGIQWHAIRADWREFAHLKEQFELAPDWERPAHVVVISTPFYMSPCEITQRQYEAVMGTNPSQVKHPLHPVDSVTWNDAAAFCEKAQALCGRRVQLPTEAQWEYACRANTDTLFNTGETISPDQANIDGNMTADVGRYTPNKFGLHDMHGNVWEWCSDFYSDDYYKESPARDPQGPPKSPYGNARTLRGGSCRGDPDFYRSASRRWVSADDSDEDVGFRVILRIQNEK